MGVEDGSMDINLAIQALAKFARYTNACANKVPYVIVDRKPFQFIKKEPPEIERDLPAVEIESGNERKLENQKVEQNIPEDKFNEQNAEYQCDLLPKDNVLQEKVRNIFKAFTVNSQMANRCRFCDKVFVYVGNKIKHENEKHPHNYNKNEKPQLSESSTTKSEKINDKSLNLILNSKPKLENKCRFCDRIFKYVGSKIKHENEKHVRNNYKNENHQLSESSTIKSEKGNEKSLKFIVNGDLIINGNLILNGEPQLENKCRFCDKVFKHASRKTKHENEKHLQHNDSKNQKPQLSESSTKKSEKIDTKSLNSILNDKPQLSDSSTKKSEKINKKSLKSILNGEPQPKLIKHKKNQSLQNCRKKNVVFSCDLCHKTFDTHRLVSKHIWNVHRARRHVCTICKMKFKHQYQLEIHLNTHTRLRSFQCDNCKQQFATKSAVKYHVLMKVCTKKEVTNKLKSKVTCHLCKKIISTKANLKKHLIVCDPKYEKNTEKCAICDKSFKTKSYLRKHLVHSHSSQRECICHHCNRKFTRKDNLKFHLYSRCLHKWNEV
ncbi:PR domain zinc finger protein 5-like [Trichogramma pretiosum]|uniref:PR domain zinc finger protein 5-like n=1 Tax=Trichogramma pretiosum TaxID=7493 RepID=UPI0006C9B268|nr:PR domain zinc finger protein 5-like [Trichogramma pretiosum]